MTYAELLPDDMKAEMRRFVRGLAKHGIIDAVEVVRCKDCKYAEHWYGDKARCFLWSENGIDVFEDGYCNYGKRREDG